MARMSLYAAIVVAAALFVPAVVAAVEPPMRVAILDFQDYPGQADAKGLGASFSRLLSVSLGSDPVVGKRFQVVERKELRQVIDEKKLAATGVLDPASTHTSGRLLGVSYFIIGGFDAFSKTRERRGIALLKSDVVTAKATITVRFVDTRTAAQTLAFLVEAKASDKAVTVDSKDPSKAAEWTRSTEVGVLDELLKKAAQDAVRELKKQDRLRSLKPMEPMGRIVKIDRTQVWISLGSEAGVEKGGRFQVLRQGSPLVDRKTGRILGSVEKEVDLGEAVTVAELYSVLRLSRGVARMNDLVRPAPPATGDAAAAAQP